MRTSPSRLPATVIDVIAASGDTSSVGDQGTVAGHHHPRGDEWADVEAFTETRWTTMRREPAS